MTFLTAEEIDALLAAPDQTTWIGRRDHALLLLAVRTGLRVSELTNLTYGDLHLGTGAHIRVTGKGRKQRCIPIAGSTLTACQRWLAERAATSADPLFATRRGNALSVDAIEARIVKYRAIAARSCPSLATKNVSPHTLQHMRVICSLHAGVDITVIALWLGHETIQSMRPYTCGHGVEGACARTSQAPGHDPRPLPARRRTAGLPRGSLNRPSLCRSLPRHGHQQDQRHSPIGITEASA